MYWPACAICNPELLPISCWSILEISDVVARLRGKDHNVGSYVEAPTVKCKPWKVL